MKKYQTIALTSLLIAAPHPLMGEQPSTQTMPTTQTPITDKVSEQISNQSLSDAQVAAVVIAVNQSEIRAGKWVQKVSKNKEVVAFARQMVAEHSQSVKELNALIGKLKIKPAESALQKDLQTAAIDGDAKLKGKKGSDFDKTYVDQHVAMHQTVLHSLDTQLLPNVDNADFKAHLSKVRSHIAKHLDHAKQLQNASPQM